MGCATHEVLPPGCIVYSGHDLFAQDSAGRQVILAFFTINGNITGLRKSVYASAILLARAARLRYLGVCCRNPRKLHLLLVLFPLGFLHVFSFCLHFGASKFDRPTGQRAAIFNPRKVTFSQYLWRAPTCACGGSYACVRSSRTGLAVKVCDYRVIHLAFLFCSGARLMVLGRASIDIDE